MLVGLWRNWNPIHCCWGCKLGWPLLKIGWLFLNKLNIEEHMISIWFSNYLKAGTGDFPGDPAVKTPCSQCRGPGFDFWSGNWSNQSILSKSTLNIHWKDWCWSWSSSALDTGCEELTHWQRPCLMLGKTEGRRWRGWDGWIVSPTQWTGIWANFERVEDRGAWPAAVHGSQRAGHDSATEQQQQEGTRSHTPWLRASMLQLKVLCAATKDLAQPNE